MPDRPPPKTSVWNVPNQVTVSRLVLTLVLFVLLGLQWYLASLLVFIVAASTDWVDGYWARKYGQVTQLGRILDPFADKLIICGTYIYLSAVPPTDAGVSPSGIAVWVTVLVVGRELLVTALRSFVEGHGGDFSAKWIGKWKMVAQCVAAVLSMAQLTYLAADGREWDVAPPQWLFYALLAFVWVTVLLTLYSAVVYVMAAVQMLGRGEDG